MEVQVDVRALFPVTKRYVYFNSAAVGPLSTCARAAMRRLVQDQTIHGIVHYDDWWETYERCRERGARLIGACPDEIALVANTSTGISTVARGLRARPGDNVVIPDREFPANVYPWMALRGVELRRVPKRDGRLLPEDVAALIDDRTIAVSVSFVDWLTGHRADLAAIGAVVRDSGALYCVDAIQGLGALALDVAACGIDALAADGHKWLCGPEGAGLLYVSREARERIAPTRPSWLSVRHPTRYLDYDLAPARSAQRYQDGTPNTCGVYGLDAALQLIEEITVPAIEARILELAARLRAGAKERGLEPVCDPPASEASGIVSFRTEDASVLATAMEGRDVIVAARDGALRIAVHHFNNEEDVDRLLELFQ
ncbi:MAG: aminotransferase class V-fold PLP-dependent enzyme [Planctomycetota bacterium]|nr:aminotransferase class V-fold PLP-dependent enzyme [Planctomycetota bacterium]